MIHRRLIFVALAAIFLIAVAASGCSGDTVADSVASPAASPPSISLPRISGPTSVSAPKRIAGWDSVPDAVKAAPSPSPGIAVLQSGGTTLRLDTATAVVTEIGVVPADVPSERYVNTQFAPSPDGTRFAYACEDDASWSPAGSGNLCVAGPGAVRAVVADETVMQRRAVTKQAVGTAVRLTWSPDGRRISFAAFVDGFDAYPVVADVYIVDLDTGLVARVIEDQGDGSWTLFRWSPDSTRLALQGTSNGFGFREIMVFDTAHGTTMTVTAPPGDVAGHILPGFDWAPDSERIAFVAADGRAASGMLYVVDVRDGTVTPLVDDAAVSPVAWSPGGDWIAYSRIAGAASPRVPLTEFSIVRPNGSASHAVSDVLDSGEWPYAWSPDEQRIALKADAAGSGPGLYVLDVATGGPTLIAERVSSSGYAEFAIWSSDGERLYFTQGYCMKGFCTPGSLMASALDGAPPRVVHDALIDRVLWYPR